MSEWISVKDKFPKRHETILIFSDEADILIGSYQGKNWWSDYGEVDYVLRVTHWMPLPNPPKVAE